MKGQEIANSPLSIPNLESPEQIFGLINNQPIRELIAIIIGETIPNDRPEWAARAAREFWKGCVDFPKAQHAKSENYRLGYLWGMGRGLGSSLSPAAVKSEQAFLAFFNSEELGQLIHSSVAKAQAQEAADFYAGFSDGLRRGDHLSPSSGAVIFLIFAVAWRELSEFTSVPDVQRWLTGILGENLVGSRERVAKLCRRIHFPLTHKGGRPAAKPRKRTTS